MANQPRERRVGISVCLQKVVAAATGSQSEKQLFDVACSACQTAADGSALNRQVIEIAQLVRE